MKYVMFKHSMIVMDSNYNNFEVSIRISFRYLKQIRLHFAFWSIAFAYDREDYA